MATLDSSDVGSAPLPGAWNDLRLEVRNRWPRMTSDDLDTIAGDRGRLVRCLRRRYGLPPDELERQVNVFLEARPPGRTV